MNGPRVTRERDPKTGRLVERFRGGPKVKVEQVTPDRTDVHPELKGERRITETVPVREFVEALGRHGERAKVDGVTTASKWPRRSRLADAMAEADDLDAGGLAQAAALPRPMIEDLIKSAGVPASDAHREAIEAVLPNAFPERRVPASMAETISGASAATGDAGRAAEARRAERGRTNDQRLREAKQAAERQERGERRRLAELQGLPRITAAVARLQAKLTPP